MKEVIGSLKELKNKFKSLKEEEFDWQLTFVVVLMTFFFGFNGGLYLMLSNRALKCNTYYILVAITLIELVESCITCFIAAKKINQLETKLNLFKREKKLLESNLEKLVVLARLELPMLHCYEITFAKNGIAIHVPPPDSRNIVKVIVVCSS